MTTTLRMNYINHIFLVSDTNNNITNTSKIDLKNRSFKIGNKYISLPTDFVKKSTKKHVKPFHSKKNIFAPDWFCRFHTLKLNSLP